MILFTKEELATQEVRKYVLCVVVNNKNIGLESCLVGTSTSINVLPQKTLNLCGIPKDEIQPSYITVTTYHNSRKLAHVMVTLDVELRVHVLSPLIFTYWK